MYMTCRQIVQALCHHRGFICATILGSTNLDLEFPAASCPKAQFNKEKIRKAITRGRFDHFAATIAYYKNKNWLQFLFIVKAAVLKQQISNFFPQIQRTEASDHIYFSQRPFINVKAIFCA